MQVRYPCRGLVAPSREVTGHGWGLVRTRSWMVPPQGKGAPRVGPMYCNPVLPGLADAHDPVQGYFSHQKFPTRTLQQTYATGPLVLGRGLFLMSEVLL